MVTAALARDDVRAEMLRQGVDPTLVGHVRIRPAVLGVLQRAGAECAHGIGREIGGAAKRYNVDSLLLASIVEAESSFRPDAVSEKGALGLMQLMPLHFPASDSALEQPDPLDPTVNLDFGARYLRDLRKRYDGDLELALAAYHAGPGTIYSEHQREAGAASPVAVPAEWKPQPARIRGSGEGS